MGLCNQTVPYWQCRGASCQVKHSFPRIYLGKLHRDYAQSGMLKILSQFPLFLLPPSLWQNPFTASQRTDVIVHEASHPFSWRLLCCSRVQSNPTTCAGHSLQIHPLVECTPAKLPGRSLAAPPHSHQICHCVAATPHKAAPQTVAQAEILPGDYSTGQQQLPPCSRWARHQHLQLQGETNQGLTDEMNWALLMRAGCRWVMSYYTIKKKKPEEPLLSAVLGSRDIKQSSWPCSSFGMALLKSLSQL